MVYSRWVQVKDKGLYEVIGSFGRLTGLVASKTVPNAFHVVKDGACDCEGFKFRKRCVHVEAVRLFNEIEARSRCKECGERLQSTGRCRCWTKVK
jgi:hypothetical protein